MLDRMTRATQVKQVAIVVAITLVLLNVAFYLLSASYYGGQKLTAFQEAQVAVRSSVRIAFAIFTMLVGVASIIAAAAPRLVGHVIAAVIGVISIIASLFAFARGMTPVLPFTLLLLGILLPLLAYFSMKTSRAAWAFLTSTCAVYATVLMFGAPKVRFILDIGLWSAMIIPGILAVATAALVMSKAAYRDAV